VPDADRYVRVVRLVFVGEWAAFPYLLGGRWRERKRRNADGRVTIRRPDRPR
jgi:hypothetical protein